MIPVPGSDVILVCIFKSQRAEEERLNDEQGDCEQGDSPGPGEQRRPGRPREAAEHPPSLCMEEGREKLCGTQGPVLCIPLFCNLGRSHYFF